MKPKILVILAAALICLALASYDTVNAGWFGPRKDSEPKPRPNSALTAEKVPGCFTLTVGAPQYKNAGRTWNEIATFYGLDSSPLKRLHFQEVNKGTYSEKRDRFYILMKGDKINIPDPDLGYDFSAKKPGQLLAGFPKAGDCAEKRSALIAKAPAPQPAPEKCVSKDKDMEIAELRALMADLIKKVDSLQTAGTAPEECVEVEAEEDVVRTVKVYPKNEIRIEAENGLRTVEIRDICELYNTVEIHPVPNSTIIIKGPEKVRITDSPVATSQYNN